MFQRMADILESYVCVTKAATQQCSAKSLVMLGKLYLKYEEQFDALRKYCSTVSVEYPAAKIIDMCFLSMNCNLKAAFMKRSELLLFWIYTKKMVLANPPAKHHKFVFGPLRSTRWTLHEHLLFQRRLCRKGVAVMSKQNPRVKALCLDPRVFCMYTC